MLLCLLTYNNTCLIATTLLSIHFPFTNFADYRNIFETKVVLICESALTRIFKLFPANIWILKFRFCSLERGYFNDYIKNQGYSLSSKIILMAKIMRKRISKFKCLKTCVGASSQISSTLVNFFKNIWSSFSLLRFYEEKKSIINANLFFFDSALSLLELVGSSNNFKDFLWRRYYVPKLII